MARKTQIKPTPSQLARWDKEYLWHPFTQHYIWKKEDPLIIESGRGVYLKDVKGRRFIDGVSSLWVNLHGHNHPALNRALVRQIKKISHSTFLGLTHPPAILLGRALVQSAPAGLSRVFYSDNGATAVEVALKMAFQYWMEKEGQGRRVTRDTFLAVKGSYHGDTLGAVSVGGVGAFHSKFKPLLFKSRFAMAPACRGCRFNKKESVHRTRLGEPVKSVPRPGDKNPDTGCRWECLADVERILKKDGKRIAAGVLEPVMQGAAGMLVQPKGYVAGFTRLLKKHRVLMIADEVATGFGRTGSLFAVSQEKVRPDFLCLAKGITGGYSPLAATLTTQGVFRAFFGPVSKGRTFFHGHSYTAHPLGAALGLASLDLLKRQKYLEKTGYLAKLMSEELDRIRALPTVGSVRQAGLMAGIEVVQRNNPWTPFPVRKRMGARLCRRLLNKGIWIRPLGDTLVIMPPLVISAAQLKKLIRSVASVIQDETKTGNITQRSSSRRFFRRHRRSLPS